MNLPAPTRDERQEPPCIWVLAGVLSYRLCDREYECEGCELFHALAGSGSHSSHGPGRSSETPESLHSPDAARARTLLSPDSWTDEQVTSYLYHVLGDCRLYLDRYYRPPHFWLLDEGDGTVRVGLAGHVRRVFEPIDQIVTPSVGLHLERGQPCGWIVRDGMVISLSMPISGVISAVNDAYLAVNVARPDSADLWLFQIECSEPVSGVEDLVRGQEMLLWYLDSIRTLKRYLHEALASPTGAEMGPVMADGGVRAACLEDVLGRARFERLLHEIA